MLTAYCFPPLIIIFAPAKHNISCQTKKAVHIASESSDTIGITNFTQISVTYFTKSALYTFLTRKLQLFIDSYKELLYYHAHNLITGDEEKSKCTSLAKRAFVTVQEGAGGDIEDGLGADGLRCMHLGRPGAPVTVLEY